MSLVKYDLPVDSKSVYKPFKRACQDLHLTYVEVAAATGISRSKIAKFMSDASDVVMSANELADIALFLNEEANTTVISLDELFGIKDTRPDDNALERENFELRQDVKLLKAEVQHKDELLANVTESRDKHEKLSHNRLVALIVIGVVLFCLLLADCLNGGWGYFRYTSQISEMFTTWVSSTFDSAKLLVTSLRG